MINPTALTHDRIRELAPSVFAPAPFAGVSTRYSFFSTAQVLDLFHAEGWAPVRAQEQNVRLEDRRGFQTHVLRFARIDDLLRPFLVDEVRPELVLRNSHDRSCAFQLSAGLFRKVCANGLVLPDAAVAGVSLRHADLSQEAFLSAANTVAAATPSALECVRAWRGIALNDARRTELAGLAIAARWPALADRPLGLKPEHVLTARRYGDNGRDLWTTFNVIQENLVRGIRSPAPSRRASVRRVRSPLTDLALNRALWSIAADFSRN